MTITPETADHNTPERPGLFSRIRQRITPNGVGMAATVLTLAAGGLTAHLLIDAMESRLTNEPAISKPAMDADTLLFMGIGSAAATLVGVGGICYASQALERSRDSEIN